MRDYVQAMYNSLKVMVRLFYSAAGDTTMGTSRDCPVKLPFDKFFSLYQTLFPCKTPSTEVGADPIDCVTRVDIQKSFFDELGAQDNSDSGEGENPDCKLILETEIEYKK